MAKRRNKVDLCLLKAFLCIVRNTLSDPAERKAFEEWYYVTYGKEYVWKYVKKGEENKNDDTENCEAGS